MSSVEMFNKKAAKPKYKADQILKTLSIKPGQMIADIGSGGGYYTFRFSKAVGEQGKVYAVDVNQEFLDYIKDQADEKGLSNIVTVPIAPEGPVLPEHIFDYLFFRNATHHIADRVDYFSRLKPALKPDGKIIIIEYDGRGGRFSFQRLHKHFIPREVLIEEMKEAGYNLFKSYDFLSEQSFLIFSST